MILHSKSKQHWKVLHRKCARKFAIKSEKKMYTLWERERGKKQGRRRTLFSFHFSMWWKKKPQCNVVSRYGAPWTEILQKCAIFMEFVLCIEIFFVNEVGSKKGSTKWRKIFRCWLFRFWKYMLLRQVEQSFFFNFLPNFWKSHQKC